MTDRTSDMAPSPSFYAGSDLEALSDLRRYQDWILRDFRPQLHGRVLEVGAGIGNLARQYAPSVRELVLLEPAENLLPELRRRTAQLPHVEVVGGTVETYAEARSATGDGAFDAVLMVNVLEHIAEDVDTLAQLRAMLRPGGALLIFVPAGPWLYGSLDTMVDHVKRYARDDLAETVRAAGFDIRLLKYFDVAGALPWWFTGRVLKHRTFSAGAAKVFDRWVVPVMSRVERRVRLPVGKNLSCVAVVPRDEPAA